MNETTEITNKNSWITFRNKAILLNNIRGEPLMEPNDNTAKVCEGIVELDESQQAKLEEIERSLKHGFKRLNAAK